MVVFASERNSHPHAANVNVHFTNPHNFYLQLDPKTSSLDETAKKKK